MKRFISLLCRPMLFAVVGAALLSPVRVWPHHVGTSDASVAADSRDSVRAAASEARIQLRKLHIVRPDLIPYPLAIEVYC